jgi:hypothetical protein
MCHLTLEYAYVLIERLHPLLLILQSLDYLASFHLDVLQAGPAFGWGERGPCPGR